MSVDRKPALRRPTHPAANLPERTEGGAGAVAGSDEERLTEQHNVRIKPSTKTRLTRGVDKLRYESGDRSVSIASITDKAIVEYLERNGC